MARGLLDTSVLIARERGQVLGPMPDEGAVSVLTLAELQFGALVMVDAVRRRRALALLVEVEREFEALPVDRAVARAFAEVRAEGRRLGLTPTIVDALIAATAMSNRLPVYTRDRDFDQVPGLEVIHV
jgi:predicted nucleic acid-binding protein